jgi:anaerobic ribonucleoside-triphosphate reductase activating protein
MTWHNDTIQDSAAVWINLADFTIATDVLGPGRRAILWVQGCPRRCKGCITEHMQPFDIDREWITAAHLAQRILAHAPLEGITLVGGEPFSHAHALATLVRELHATTALSVVTYTGHTRAWLEAHSCREWQALLAVTDLLIDGEYRADQACNLLWRGSSNQQLHFLTPRYAPLEPLVQHAPGERLEFQIRKDGQVRLVGVPTPDLLRQLVTHLRERHIECVW